MQIGDWVKNQSQQWQVGMCNSLLVIVNTHTTQVILQQEFLGPIFTVGGKTQGCWIKPQKAFKIKIIFSES